MGTREESKKRKSRKFDDEETSGIYALLSLSAVAKNARRKKNLGHKVVDEKPVSPSKKREAGRGHTPVPQSLRHVHQSLETVFSRFDTRMFCTREFFYSEVDREWCNEGMHEVLDSLGIGREELLQAEEWWAIRSLLGKPRRLSKSFLHDSRVDLHVYRKERSALSGSLRVGQRVSAIHPQMLEIQDGVILTALEESCRVQFDRVELGVHLVPKHAIVAKPHEVVPPVAAAAAHGMLMERKRNMVPSGDEVDARVNDVYSSSVKTIESNKRALHEGSGRCLLHEPCGVQNSCNMHIQQLIDEVARLQNTLKEKIKVHVRTLVLLRARPETLPDLKASLGIP